jgi:hypothetical protein
MKAEFELYPNDVENIKVLFKNNTNRTLHFGLLFTIQQKIGDDWHRAFEDVSVIFPLLGITSSPASRSAQRKEFRPFLTYNVRAYTDYFEDGYYRIATSFSIKGEDYTVRYLLYAEFSVGAV